MFKTVGLVARYDKKAALKLAEELAENLAKKGLKVYLEDTLAGKVHCAPCRVRFSCKNAD